MRDSRWLTFVVLLAACSRVHRTLLSAHAKALCWITCCWHYLPAPSANGNSRCDADASKVHLPTKDELLTLPIDRNCRKCAAVLSSVLRSDATDRCSRCGNCCIDDRQIYNLWCHISWGCHVLNIIMMFDGVIQKIKCGLFPDTVYIDPVV